MWQFPLDPITRKRLQRFRQIRRAWWSFWILLALYLLSMIAEVLCNDRPLLVRHDGRTCFPFLTFIHYTDDQFTGSGIHTRADFKALAQSPLFRDRPGNFMLWPPVPYGPMESVDPASIPVADEVTVNFRPQARQASVDLGADLTIVGSTGLAALCGGEEAALRGQRLDTLWPLSEALREAIARRFANRAAERYEAPLQRAGGPGVRVSLRAYEPRDAAPAKVRLNFEERLAADIPPERVRFDRRQQVQGPASPLWTQLTPEEREKLLAQVRQRLSVPVEAVSLTLGGRGYRVEFAKEDVRFPFRPVAGHPLGLDAAGRDVLARLLYGARVSLNFALLLTLFSMALGIVIGAVQGYFAGWMDIVSQRLIEVWSALPFLYIMIIVGSIFGRRFWLLLLIYGIFHWIGISYYLRAEFLKLRSAPFVEAAKCLGLPTWKILFHHILPNALVPVITFFPFSLVGSVGVLTSLDFLGFGLPPTTVPSWGDLFQQAQQAPDAWWLTVSGFTMLFAVMLLGTFVGEGVRKAFDPKRFSHLE